ncbi:Peptidoglycan glycosyltransferase MrdB [Candidatus Kinetoplastibacterium sorsogonicusi]|uniref:Peptidoglycan glycosyltransferase MrdB n=1 Tax=Candidatus Kinetoplastidibacterium kentomonadis TaxID=1576550 RepID=A0A3Q8F6Z6_9PROT|nr:rod shape-determining protein RodA [Candidatus Kinetoplastibacterium sorsogonicusi]AWD32733.1 Peptidoglycan glycosyltransferase MrdB [Candidatus Kinetoplastibacterium sorsogonicusi]
MEYIRSFFIKAFNLIDTPIIIILSILFIIGMVSMYSAAGSGIDAKFIEQFRNFIIALVAIFIIANIPSSFLIKISFPMYIIGLLSLIGVEYFGETIKGATRWLNLGFIRIQPSEIMKISVPMALSWYFHNYSEDIRYKDFIIATIILLLPFILIMWQPDLGTALLIFGAGIFVIYFAGLPFKLIIPTFIIISVGIFIFLYNKEFLCDSSCHWYILHEYQKNRICTLLNPNSDPLGKGFHIIQSMVAIGSGGLYGKGYMHGTQTHLDFIPERTTDFIFAVFAEEFGFYGCCFLIFMYCLLIIRCIELSTRADSQFGRLLSGSISMMIFLYVLVNIGMVTGLFPVVGIPLPFMSYGGTSLSTLGIALGLIMNISNRKKLL